MLIKGFCIACILCGLPFLQGSFNLIHFDRNWFLIDIDVSKPGVIQGLSLNVTFIIFFRDTKVSSKDSNFSREAL